MTSMKQDTPYRTRPGTERARELLCFQDVLPPSSPTRFVLYEAFGGVGMVASLLLERFPNIQVESAELDRECVETYRAANPSPRAAVFHGDTNDLLDLLESFQAASLDYNKCTLRDLQDPSSFQSLLLARVVGHAPDWIQITNSAIGKLHLNWRSYGIQSYQSRDQAQGEYEQKLSDLLEQRHGYRLSVSSNHSAASYHLAVPSRGKGKPS